MCPLPPAFPHTSHHLHPTAQFCRIRNACFLSEREGSVKEPSAQMSSAAAVPPLGGSPEELARLNTWTEFPIQIRAKALWYDILDYVEDPMKSASWMYDQQQKMRWDPTLVQSGGLTRATSRAD